MEVREEAKQIWRLLAPEDAPGELVQLINVDEADARLAFLCHNDAALKRLLAKHACSLSSELVEERALKENEQHKLVKRISKALQTEKEVELSLTDVTPREWHWLRKPSHSLQRRLEEFEIGCLDKYGFYVFWRKRPKDLYCRVDECAAFCHPGSFFCKDHTMSRLCQHIAEGLAEDAKQFGGERATFALYDNDVTHDEWLLVKDLDELLQECGITTYESSHSSHEFWYMGYRDERHGKFKGKKTKSFSKKKRTQIMAYR